MGSFSAIHWVIAAIVVLALFGPKTLSNVGKTAGKGVRSAAKLKKSITDVPEKVISDITRIDRGPRA
jgi:TatA/E family protein of Tat protein translocase